MRVDKASCLLALLFLFFECTSDNDDPIDQTVSKRVRFASFGFEKRNNPSLQNDYYSNNTDSDTLYFFIPDVESPSLVPSFTGDLKKVSVGGISVSGTTAQDFNYIVKYDIESNDGQQDSCFVKVLTGNGIPRIEINTNEGVAITSKTEYVNAHIKISNCPDNGLIESDCKIRGRGNATWGHPKKSYKFKFSEKQSPFGFPANKDWVLLGNYTDRSLLRTSYMCEVSRALNIKYTVNTQHVDFFLNGEYLGTYLFSDHIEKSNNRVQVNDDGFFIEGDNYYQYEPLYFVTDSFKIGMTFKYPDPDKGQISKDDENYRFIQDYMNKVEKLLLNIPNGGRDYKELIEPHSFAKFIIAEEVLANFDSNFFYILSSRNSKLEIYPLWDFEWSLGLSETTETAWVLPPNKPRIDVAYWNRYPYTKYLYYDTDFISILQEEWSQFKPHIPEIVDHIQTIRESLNYSQKDNFERWPILDTFVSKELVVLGDWNLEVDYINDFFVRRAQWFDDYVNNLNEIYKKMRLEQ